MENTSDFDEIVKKGLHIVDKTLFIREFMTYGGKVCKILRPQRFGKSFNLSMLKSFLSIGADPSKFAPFEIGKPEHQSFVEKHCGKYPVVYLTFKDIKGNTWEEMSTQIVQMLQIFLKCYDKYLSEWDPHKLKDLQNPSVTIEKFTFVLFLLTKTLSKLHESPVIVLIDKYDAPLDLACREGYYEKAANFFVSFYSCGLKDNANLEKACLMGIVEIRSVGSFSSFNNATIYSIDDKLFSSSFGFTEDEIRKFLRDENTECESDVEKLLEWYNGYNIGNVVKVVNPWSFISWYQKKEFKEYWVDTSFSDTIKILFEKCIPTGQNGILKLLGNEPVSTSPLSTAINYSQKTLRIGNILHLLVLNGYLSYKLPVEGSGIEIKTKFPSMNDQIEVYIPNLELKMHWQHELIDLFTAGNAADYSKIRLEFYQAITAIPFNIGSIDDLLQNYFMGFFSHYDFKNKNSYHVALGLFFLAIFLGDEDFVISSNREGGNGGYEILIQIKSIKRVLCFELKRADEEKGLQGEAINALNQIGKKEYTAGYANYECIPIGVAFSKKSMSKLVMCAPGEGSDVGPILRKRAAANTSASGTVAKLKKPRGAAEPVAMRNLRKRARPEGTVAATKKKTRK